MSRTTVIDVDYSAKPCRYARTTRSVLQCALIQISFDLRPTEVQRGANLVQDVAVGKRIGRVETVPDELVFSGITHEDFVSPNHLNRWYLILKTLSVKGSRNHR